jgi:hypothetical protein
MLLLLTASTLRAATVTASWNPNPEPDIAGYKLLYGTGSGSYSSSVDVGNVTSYVLSVSAGQTYFFTVQAYNTAGMQSSYSTEASFTVPASTAPAITSLTPSIGWVGYTMTISGANFGATQGSSTVTFNGAPAIPASWSATSIVVPVPAGATTGNVVVTVAGVVSNGMLCTITAAAPSLTNVAPTAGVVGTAVTIAGANFGTTKGTSTVTFNGTPAAPTAWSSSSIVVPVPAGATTGNIVVTVGGAASNGLPFTVTAAPTMTALAPPVGPAGTLVTITGANFGASKGTSSVTFNGIAASPASWSATSIVVPAPAGAATGNVVVTVGGLASNGLPYTYGTPSSITLVQHIGKDAGTTSSATLAFPSNNTAGNWLAVAIRAGQQNQTFTITDTRGNTYRRAVQLTESVDGVTIAIFYAENIAGGANTVTVADSLTGGTLRFAILEYAGVAQANSLDAAVAAEGSGTAVSSGSSTTTSNGDLVIGMISTASGVGVAAGAGFVAQEQVPASGAKIAVEDSRQTAAGSIAATATLPTGDGWGAAMAAFRAAVGAALPTPSLTSVAPANGPVGTSVTISGANFGASKGTSAVTFNGTAATPTAWSATAIVVPVPAGATTGNVIVTVGGVASNALPFTVSIAPSLTSVAPVSGQVGTSVTINGANFGASKGASTIAFNGVSATPTAWSAASIVVPVPAGAVSGNIVVTVGSLASNALPFTVVAAPTLTTINPSGATVGTSVTIAGANFGAAKGASTVTFNGTAATPSAWSATSIVVPVPAGAASGNVVVTVNGLVSNALPFTVSAAPTLTTLAPSSGIVGASVTIAGANFGATQGASTVTFNGTAATPSAWSAGSIVVPVPGGAASGNIVVTVGGLASNPLPFTVLVAPTLSSVSPAGAVVGTSVTISGANFGATKGTSTVTFNGIPATPTNWWATGVVVPVPAGATTGGLVITVGGLVSNALPFAVTIPPAVTSLAPASGSVAMPVTIAGTNFGATQGASTVTFNGMAAAPTAWSATSIVVPVPNGTTSGSVVVMVAGAGSNGVTFTVVRRHPAVDFDGDGKSEIAVYQPGTGTLSWLESHTGFATSSSIGGASSTDMIVSGDYDGDGKADLAAYRQTGEWIVLRSSTGAATSLTIGSAGAVPVPGDYDGDGKTDIAVYRAATASWTIVASRTNTTTTTVFGKPGDIAVPGDYDGDGKTDMATYQSTTGLWTMRLSSTGVTQTATCAGAGLRPVPADYDGDGKIDPAVYEAATGRWTMRLSSSGSLRVVTLGGSTAVAVPADYDGDGIADVAVTGPAGQWTIQFSTTGQTFAMTLGGAGSVPSAQLPSVVAAMPIK